jgi:transcriptional regulator with XRE-family HTH domain
MSHKLQNYLRTYRKRTGLSQDEVAFLLGCQSGAKVSRYERLSRKPSLETALAYEVLFSAPARDLFAGIFQKVEEKTKGRAQLLAQKLDEGKKDRMTRRKLEILASISSGSGISP